MENVQALTISVSRFTITCILQLQAMFKRHLSVALLQDGCHFLSSAYTQSFTHNQLNLSCAALFSVCACECMHAYYYLLCMCVHIWWHSNNTNTCVNCVSRNCKTKSVDTLVVTELNSVKLHWALEFWNGIKVKVICVATSSAILLHFVHKL